MELKIEYLPTGDLIPYARNSRTHTDEQVAQVAASIREFGFASPVLIGEDKTIIAGHCRVMAAQKLGLETVPTVTATGWTDAQKRAYVIVDNRLAENAGWDVDMLKTEFADLDELGFDLSLLGFDDSEMADLLADDEATEPLTDPDEIPEPEETPVTRAGDIWTLGNHRLMCGDSTNGADVALLMDGERADIAFTSPPYNAGGVTFPDGDMFKHAWKKAYADGYQDSLSSEDYIAFASSVLGACFDNCARFIFWNVSYNANSRSEYIAQIVPFLPRLIEQVAWKKTSAVPLRGSMRRAWEPIYIFSVDGEGLPVGEVVTNIREVSNTGAQSEDHKACFPVALPEKGIEASGARSVLDPFCGTGTTIIAAQMKGIRAFGMEIDPHYCDVIIHRWQNLTGKQATMDGKTYDQLKEERNGSPSA